MTSPAGAPLPTLPAARRVLIIGIVTLVASPVLAAVMTYVIFVGLQTTQSLWFLALPLAALPLVLPPLVLGLRVLGELARQPGYRGRGATLAGMAIGVLGGLATVGLGLVGSLFVAAAAAGPGGRPFRVAGRVRTAPSVRGADWASGAHPTLEGLDQGHRAELAAAWEDEARGEHASIAAFSRLCMDLLAVGAPPGLITGAQRAALDEVSHARACYGMASAYAGEPRSAGAWPEVQRAEQVRGGHEGRLAALAADSLLDGCLLEGFSAAAAHEGARRTTDPGVRAVLAVLAADETRHALLGWAVIDWCLSVGGAPVAEAIARAASELPTAQARHCLVPGDRAVDAAETVFATVRARVIEEVQGRIGPALRQVA